MSSAGDAPGLSEELQRRWSALHLPQVNGIVHASGAVLRFDHSLRWPAAGRLAAPVDRGDLRSVRDDDWISVIVRAEVQVTGGLQVQVGEGEMGNEGFVAVSTTSELLWAGVFWVSNPFYDVEVRDGLVLATNTHDEVWRFTVDAPEAVHVLEG